MQRTAVERGYKSLQMVSLSVSLAVQCQPTNLAKCLLPERYTKNPILEMSPKLYCTVVLVRPRCEFLSFFA